MLTKEQVEWNRKLITALRSGEYQQAQGALRRIEEDGSAGFCCLGVACDITELGSWHHGRYCEPGFDEDLDKVHVGTPKKGIMALFGFERMQGHLLDGKLMTEWNDDVKSTFDTIATKLELWLADQVISDA